MTPQGRAHVVHRLTSCPDLAALRTVWGGLGYAYQADGEIIALKDRIKADMEAATRRKGRVA